MALEIIKMIWESVYVVTILGTIIVVVAANRNPVKTISWILVLVFLPVIGLVGYFFFGQDIRRKYLMRKDYKKLRRLNLGKKTLREIPAIIRPEYIQLVRLFNKDLFPVSANNTVDIYSTGKDKFDVLFSELEKAQSHIHLEYYIFDDDEIGRRLQDVLIRKSRSGVEVRVIYDDVGSWSTKNSFFKQMKDANVQVYSFLKVRFPVFTSKINYRNHRKIVVIDGQVGFIGGMNIAKRYVSGTRWGIWDDLHLKITGDAVLNLQSIFLIDWILYEGAFLNDKKYFPPVHTNGTSKMQIVSGGPTSQWQDILQGFLKAISIAQKYVYIQTPYFLPTDTLLTAMRIASLGGVDVRLMIPENSDSLITRTAARSYVKELLRMGVKVYFYRIGFLHSKMMVIDDYFSTVGSTNIDFRSFEHNFEANAFIYDETIAKTLKSKFLNDIKHSSRIMTAQWKKRPRWKKMAESIVRIFSPLL
jgi:cardiolipin synthase